MALDQEGKRLREIMQGKDLSWLDPPHPYWRIEPPTVLAWFLEMGWRADDYDDRLAALLGELIAAYPGSLVTYDAPPDGLKGDWKEANLGDPDWKAPETGAFKRALDKAPRVWTIPADADPAEVIGWLRRGGWSIWKANAKKSGQPKRLAQGALKTVLEHDFAFLVTSSWENEFTEIAVHPGAEETAAAA